MMAEKKRPPQTRVGYVREPAVPYHATQPLSEVFWQAFQSLIRAQKFQFLRHLLNDPEWYEELADAVAIIDGRAEPTRPYSEFAEELRREGLL